jgi:hypothetical protein
MSKRVVQVSIGIPDSVRRLIDDNVPDRLDDCFCMNFVEEDWKEGFTAHGSCLCLLGKAAEAWLIGSSPEEVKAIFTNGHDHAEG